MWIDIVASTGPEERRESPITGLGSRFQPPLSKIAKDPCYSFQPSRRPRAELAEGGTGQSGTPAGAGPGRVAAEECGSLPRAGAVHPLGSRGQWGASLAGERGDAGQGHGQVLQRHGHGPTGRTVDHGDGRAPVPLPRDQPVLQLVTRHVTAHSLPPGFLSQG